MGTHQSIRKVVTPAPTEIPDKLYFRIGDVAKLCALPAYVLRFWETEFPQLKPHKGGTGQRLYRKRDVEMVLRIKSLLYDQGYTIPGARQVFKSDAKAGPVEIFPVEPIAVATMSLAPIAVAAPTPVSAPRVFRESQLQAIHNELTALLGLLSRPVAAGFAETPVSTVKTMRPRLVLERAPRPVALAMPMRIEQAALFGFDASEFAEPHSGE